MASEVKVTGAKKIIQTFTRKAKEVESSGVDCEVGYAAPYAVYVHENLEAKHPRGGQAKFLEEAVRKLTNEGTLQAIIRMALQNGRSIEDAIMAGCLLIKMESQGLCPVETGFLRNSAFVLLRRKNGEEVRG